MRTRLKHIQTIRKRNADGTTTVHRYHRRTRRKIEGEPGTVEFLESYTEASKPLDRIPPGSIDALVRDYKASSDFTSKAKATRNGYTAALEDVCTRFGKAPLKAFRDPRIRKDIHTWRDELALKSPRGADYAAAMLRRILQFAYNQGDIDVNHARRLGRTYRSDRSDKIWTDEMIDAFLVHASAELAVALRLALDTGQRRGDLIRIPWTAYQGGRINLRQSKTARRVSIPVTKLLAGTLDNAPRGNATTILINSRGKPWTADGFQTSWRKAAIAAGIQGQVTFHDLRGTAVTRLHEAGCTPGEIAAITGHDMAQVSHILDTYTARTALMADNAIAKLEAKR